MSALLSTISAVAQDSLSLRTVHDDDWQLLKIAAITQLGITPEDCERSQDIPGPSQGGNNASS